MEDKMRIVYADPPYIGCANKYPEKTEVDHVELIRELEGYDGWALSASSPSLKILIPIINEVTTDYRIGAWVKPFCVFKPNVNPAYAWEPVIYKPARGYTRHDDTERDWFSHPITLKKNLVGAKPYEFCFWIFKLLGARSCDIFTDLYPGTGIVTRAWDNWKISHTFDEYLELPKEKIEQGKIL